MSGFAIAACPAGFLIVIFNTFRKVGMNDKADIRLVNTHPKGYSSDNDVHFIANECFLIAFAIMITEACMIRKGSKAFCLQHCCGIINTFAAGTVYNPCFACVLF